MHGTRGHFAAALLAALVLAGTAQADPMERFVTFPVIESNLDKGRGAVATVIVSNALLKRRRGE